MQNSTLHDVAKKAGTSIATVSRVINGIDTVSEEKKTNVLNAIKELNYHPNQIARSLKNDETKTIGFLVSDIGNHHFTAIAKEVEEVINRSGYYLITCSTNENKHREKKYLDMLMSKKIDGLILNSTGYNNKIVKRISQTIPVVLISRNIPDQDFRGDYVGINDYVGGLNLGSHLLENGHRNIGVVNGPMHLNSSSERYQGFLASLYQYNVDLVPENIFYGNFDEESGLQSAKHFLGLPNVPTAILFMNNSMAIGALRHFRRQGVQIPEEISITIISDTANFDLYYIQPSIFFEDSCLIGHQAGELLLKRIASKNKNEKKEVLFSSKVIFGNGVKKLNG